MATDGSGLKALLGTTVIDKSGSEYPLTALSTPDTVFGLYFSAHWCPPCKAFTPQLARFYNNMAATRPGQLEIVFVSSDKSEGEFNEYMSEMPWKALPFSDRARKGALSAKFGVRGIPTLVFVDANGKLITDQGRREVATDPEGADFPWRQKTVIEELANPALQLIKAGGAKADMGAVRAAKTIGFYFSAHWCPPCRAFTPKLAEFYTALKAKGEDVEIVFVSGDKDAASFETYLSEMPWTAIPLGNRALIGKLQEHFAIRGIPALVFVDSEGNTITTQGTSKVMSEPEGYPWPPKPVEELETVMGSINDGKVAVLFIDKLTDAAAVVAVSEAYSSVAKEYFKPDPQMQFARADEGEIAEGLRLQTGLGRERDGPHSVSVVVYDVPSGCKYIHKVDGGIPDEASIKTFVETVLAGGAERHPLK